jgi:hypothetical protein
MICREVEADVVDLARGAELDATAAARVSTHLQQCVSCASRFARERQLTTRLRAMAAAVPPSSRSAATEARLLRALAERQAAARPQPPAPRRVFAAPAARVWLAAAAALVLAAVAWQGAARWRSDPAAPSPQAPAGTPDAGAPAASAAPDVQARVEPRTADVSRPQPPRPSAPLAAAPQRPVPGTAAPRQDEVLRFVTLPGAIGLPPLESGRIVRVELPTAMLPAYGLDVTPDPGARAVEADVLVGQDGQPRAIRFVTLDSDSRRRQ